MFKNSSADRRLSRPVLVAVIGAVSLGIATAASASSITWENAETGGYLETSCTINSGDPCSNAQSLDADPASFPSVSQNWEDYRQSDSAWTEQSQYSIDTCLDSDALGTVSGVPYGQAYANVCDYSSGTTDNDLYQQWYESDTKTGWSLENAATGLYLDGGTGPNADGKFASQDVFTNGNYGNSDTYQRWH